MIIDKFGNETSMDYITSRKQLYMKEYTRLIKPLSEYDILLNKLKNNKNIMICEVDVPAIHKKGHFGKDCNENNICRDITIDRLELLLDDPSEAFGHGLCLAHALLTDLHTHKN